MGIHRGVLLFAILMSAQAQDGYVGAKVCAGCHTSIAGHQTHSNMALSWQDRAPYAAETDEGGIRYHLTHERLRVELPGSPVVSVPVEAAVGGRRHGISFLARLTELQGVKLARAPLIEARYLQSAESKGLVLSPGFPAEKPSSYETAFGRVLSPSVEKKCLACHGAPQSTPARGAGVQCEACHGPGQAHLAGLSKPQAAQGPGDHGIVNPANLSNDKSIELCARCHAGFSELIDPLPDDVLISNQVTALRNSECYIQSGQGLSCLNCHDPHTDARQDDPRYVKTCLGCHGAAGKAATCSANVKGNCIECHMPSQQKGSFALVDHWIRVHPGTGTSAGAAAGPRRATSVRPRRLFLRILVTRDRAEAESLSAQLAKGAPFFELARDHSVDPSAPSGGFLGETWVENLDPLLADAACKLNPGGISAVIPSRGKYILFQRMPRDFRWRAVAKEEEGSALKLKGALDQAIASYQQALTDNPNFLRALVFLGVAFGEKGERQRAIAALEQATFLFPRDPSAHYNLGIAYGAAGRAADEIASYRRALDLEPDLVPAYMNLGAALQAAGQTDDAAQAFEQGLQVNPLAATLYFDLGQIRIHQGRMEEARQAQRLAAIIDPRLSVTEGK